MQTISIVLILLLSACGPSTSPPAETKDVAVESGRAVWLFYIEGSQLYRALCKSEAILFNRDSCETARRHILLADVYLPLKKELEDQIQVKESEMSQWETKAKLIDARILDLLSTPVFSDPAVAAALVARIDSLQASLADIELLLTETRNQIAMIRQEPVITADYVALLNDRLAKLGSLESEKATKVAAISALRNEWLALVTDIHDQITFDLLKNQRKQTITHWEQANKDYNSKSNQLTEILRVFKYIADNSLTYDQVPSRGLYVTRGDILERISTLFTEKSEPAYSFSSHGRDSTFCASNTICAHTYVTVSRGSRAAKISCRIDSQSANCSSYSLGTPEGIRGRFATPSIDVSSENDRTTHAALWDTAATGTWRFDATCSRSGSGEMGAKIYCSIVSAD